MEGAILLIMALGGLGAFAVGVVLLVIYLRGGQRKYGDPVVYGNLVQCPRCQYMNPMDSAACLDCQLPLSHQRRTYQAPPSPTYPTLPPGFQRPVPPPNAPAHYAQPAPNQEQTVVQAPTPPAPQPPPPQSYDPAYEPSSAKGMPSAWLEGLSGVVEGQRTVLVQSDTLFGRSTQCDVQIYDPKVSRQHFVIRYGNGAFFLQDQGSSRGTLINDKPVQAQRLADGDRITLGDAVLKFHVEG